MWSVGRSGRAGDKLTMNSEIKKVLITIADLLEEDKARQVKVSLLAKTSHLSEDRIRAHLNILRDGDYINVQKNHKGEEYFHLTMKGMEKAETWKDEFYKKSFLGKVSTGGKWLLGILASAAIGFSLWYLGLSPATTNLQPINDAVPITIYDMGTTPPIDPGNTGWYQFAAAHDFPVPIDDGSTFIETFGPFVPVALDGVVALKFDVQNNADKDVIIRSVDALVQHLPVKEIEDLYQIPAWGLGGIEIGRYTVTLFAGSGMPIDSSTRLYHTKLRSNGTPVDAISVGSNKREPLEVSINLIKPGKYVITPLVNYSFLEKNLSAKSNALDVVYPNKYRTWVRDIYQGIPGTILDNNHFIIENLTGLIQQEDISSTVGTPCYPEKKWIFFTSNMITSGFFEKGFVIDSQGENLRLLASNLDDPRRELFAGWTTDGKLRLKNEDWTNQQKSYTYEVFIPSTGEKINWSQDLEKTLLSSSDLPINGYPTDYPSPDQSQIAYIKNLGLNNNECSLQGNEQLFIRDASGHEKQITKKSGLYQSLSWSPDGQFLAYSSARLENNGDKLNCSDPYSNNYDIYVMNVFSGTEYQLTTNQDVDDSPSWSADSQWVISGGRHLIISQREGSCSETLLTPHFSGVFGAVHNIVMQP
jgi:Tol biopolymer transport system component